MCYCFNKICLKCPQIRLSTRTTKENTPIMLSPGYSPPTREELQEYEEQEIARNRKRKIDATVRKLYPQVISEEHSLKRKPTKRATLEKSKQEPIKKEKRKRKIKVRFTLIS